MLCEFCGGETSKKSVKRQHWLDKKLYIAESVNAEICTECGERKIRKITFVTIMGELFKNAKGVLISV